MPFQSVRVSGGHLCEAEALTEATAETALPLGECKTCLQVAFLMGLPVKSAFAFTLDKSNRTEDEQVYEIGGVYNAKNDKCNGR